MAYDNPIPGYHTTTTTNLRLWDAEPVQEFDLEAFNAGDYSKVRTSMAAVARRLMFPNVGTPLAKLWLCYRLDMQALQ